MGEREGSTGATRRPDPMQPPSPLSTHLSVAAVSDGGAACRPVAALPSPAGGPRPTAGQGALATPDTDTSSTVALPGISSSSNRVRVWSVGRATTVWRSSPPLYTLMVGQVPPHSPPLQPRHSLHHRPPPRPTRPDFRPYRPATHSSIDGARVAEGSGGCGGRGRSLTNPLAASVVAAAQVTLRYVAHQPGGVGLGVWESGRRGTKVYGITLGITSNSSSNIK